jgi:acyl carrier protein
MSEIDVRRIVLTAIAPRVARRKLRASELRDDFSLLTSGLFDSFGLVELVAEVQGELGHEVDFSDVDPAEFATLGGLIHAIERSMRAAAE